ncbi:glycosyltransferase family 2 protein [Vagococcus sp. BWB3-3]|uniref:Glycosyltransferase family 2 protein n=1 Tax=Vagococcus allomyrinae TaxID=2794353 RepID=A0A940PF03_9ENTE|nr:glycosyltransferase family 2 protein [Vagococcus allomyrinae]MBP1043659.1 glycosyltransferase family 2 protein [Vagococcus allomyrinae]
MKQRRVAIIVLNYNNAADTVECLKSINQLTYDNYHTIVVDNHSTDDSISVLQREYPSLDLIASSINGGYAYGNNLAIKRARQEEYDYVCILNNDVIVEPDFLSQLVTYGNEHPEAGVIGPRICEYEDDSLIESAGSTVDLNYGKVTRLFHKENEEVVQGRIIPCDYIGGACMLVSMEVINQVGYIPEDYFLFYEENEWCLKIKQAGYDVVCVADAKVIHKGSASINKVSGLSEYFMYRNLVIFIRRNGTLMNKLIFYPYIALFSLKSGMTKADGWRFSRYFWDGITNKNKYQNLRG